MSRATGRKTAKKTAATRVAAPEPMDPNAAEQATPQAHVRAPRDCYALTTLVSEVMDLFPETTFEVSGTNGYGVSLDVTFSDHESPDLYPLLSLIESDARVNGVTHDHEESLVLVSFNNNMRTQDSRDPFGLAEAHQILTEDGGDIALDEETHDFVIETKVLDPDEGVLDAEPVDLSPGGFMEVTE